MTSLFAASVKGAWAAGLTFIGSVGAAKSATKRTASIIKYTGGLELGLFRVSVPVNIEVCTHADSAEDAEDFAIDDINGLLEELIGRTEIDDGYVKSDADIFVEELNADSADENDIDEEVRGRIY